MGGVCNFRQYKIELVRKDWFFDDGMGKKTFEVGRVTPRTWLFVPGEYQRLPTGDYYLRSVPPWDQTHFPGKCNLTGWFKVYTA